MAPTTRQLGHRLFPVKADPLVFFDGKPTAAAASPLHVLFMHGLLGSSRNYTSVCNTLAGADPAAKIVAEMKGEMAVARHVQKHGMLNVSAAPAAAPRAYPSMAFDWRNHGDSFHNIDTTLDGLSQDLQLALNAYALSVKEGGPIQFSEDLITNPVLGAAAVTGEHLGPIPADAHPVPIVLCAHSMGAMVMMHWVWKEHIKIWSNKVRFNELSPTDHQNIFSNELYKIVGAVVIDMAPAERPASFNKTIQMIEFLTQIPLLRFKNVKEVEKWLLENGPEEVFNQQSIFQIRYHLNNLDFSDKSQPKWKIGLAEIIGGLHAILWEEGGFESMRLAWSTMNFANRRRVLEHKPIMEHVPKMNLPFCFAFGETSTYYNDHAIDCLSRYYKEPSVIELKGADHFLFMRQKPSFMNVLKNFLYDIEKRNHLV